MSELQTITPGVYRHFKGNPYLVLGEVRHSETQEPMVLYRALYGEGGLWVRPADMFASPVDRAKYPEVEQEYRFQRVSDAEAREILAAVATEHPDWELPTL